MNTFFTEHLWMIASELTKLKRPFTSLKNYYLYALSFLSIYLTWMWLRKMWRIKFYKKPILRHITIRQACNCTANLINPFSTYVPLLHLLKTSENLRGFFKKQFRSILKRSIFLYFEELKTVEKYYLQCWCIAVCGGKYIAFLFLDIVVKRVQ